MRRLALAAAEIDAVAPGRLAESRDERQSAILSDQAERATRKTTTAKRKILMDKAKTGDLRCVMLIPL